MGALDCPEVEWYKVADTKGASSFCTGLMKPGTNPAYCFCVAMKRHVFIYEITRTKTRHQKVKEIPFPTVPQFLEIMSDARLCVGYQSGFALINITGDRTLQRKITTLKLSTVGVGLEGIWILVYCGNYWQIHIFDLHCLPIFRFLTKHILYQLTGK